ncbi:MAG TPA: CBM9 family sugar-binding protein, partial [Verrucomicrobiae bacterium]|nr:CBM9 family sugar-binding protein [Verrucomicrobiae bacterium]
MKLDFNFKDGHHCVAYDLIRTPNITKTALAAVPADAVALASFAMNHTDSDQADQLRTKIQNVTGLDVGRELFANIEQVTIFAIPAKDDSTTAFLPGQLGLAITSRNPDQTQQILTTLLETMSAGQPSPNAGQYKISGKGQADLYCYVDQVNGITLLSLNRAIVDASIAAVNNHESVCTSGPLNREINKLVPSTSKLVLVNAGGALRLLGSQMKPHSLGEEQAKQFDESLNQLAHAAAATTLELRTDEQLNNFAVNLGLTGIPPLNEVLGPATQIAQLTKQAKAEATAKRLQQEKPAIIMPATKAPAIDGNEDEVWANVPRNKLENVMTSLGSGEKAAAPTSPDDLSADFRGIWDGQNLYLLVDVTDDNLQHNSTPDQGYLDDSVEVYIDATDSKSAEFGPTDYQYRFNWDKTTPLMQERSHNQTNGIEYALVTTDKGYRVEIKFPWATLGTRPLTGAKIGLDVQVNDSDKPRKRDAKIGWHDRNDSAWHNSQAFGNAELAGLIGWWKFDETEGKIAKDSSGNNHNGLLVGNAKRAQGKIGGALDLDGQGSFV